MSLCWRLFEARKDSGRSERPKKEKDFLFWTQVSNRRRELCTSCSTGSRSLLILWNALSEDLFRLTSCGCGWN